MQEPELVYGGMLISVTLLLDNLPFNYFYEQSLF